MLKWAKDMKNHFTYDTQVANKNIKRQQNH